MKKIFTHNGQTFIFTIELNAEVERRLNGTRKHKLTVTIHGDHTNTVLLSTMIDDSNLEERIKEAEETIKKLQEKQPSETVSRLTKLGFTY